MVLLTKLVDRTRGSCFTSTRQLSDLVFLVLSPFIEACERCSAPDRSHTDPRLELLSLSLSLYGTLLLGDFEMMETADLGSLERMRQILVVLADSEHSPLPCDGAFFFLIFLVFFYFYF